jgi:hypothetical protein
MGDAEVGGEVFFDTSISTTRLGRIISKVLENNVDGTHYVDTTVLHPAYNSCPGNGHRSGLKTRCSHVTWSRRGMGARVTAAVETCSHGHATGLSNEG